MIRSMTAYGNARVESPQGRLALEFRSVNSRFLDLNFRLPDDLRMAEAAIREKLSQVVARGKIDIRASYTRADNLAAKTLNRDHLLAVAEQLKAARQVIPDTSPPRLNDLLANSDDSLDPEIWTAMCQQACTGALADFQTAREREGERLAATMLACAQQIDQIVDQVEADLPALLREHQEKLANKLREALMAASPDGFNNIGGPELSARIAQETSLFSLRIDVAEEIARLRSHCAELTHILADDGTRSKNKAHGSGKRLDFLFQEMNREANTLGSKASAISVTRAAIELKLLIEQMREQAQNIE